MPTPKDKHDREHLRRIAVIQRLIDSIYDEAVREAAAIGAGVRGVDLGKAFEFAVTETNMSYRTADHER